MIDIYNQYELSDERRRVVLDRALYSYPYFYRARLPFEDTVKNKQLASTSKIGINRDFYLTEVMDNAGEGYDVAGFGNLLLSLYTQYNQSIYRFEAGHELEQSFIANEARRWAQLAARRYDDRQRESLPYFVRNGDKVFIDSTVTAASEDFTLDVVLKGFSLIDNIYIDDAQTRQLNNSLANEVKWDYFHIKTEAGEAGKITRILENDNKPRLILGFGAVNSSQNLPTNPTVDVTITDIGRRVQLTDVAIPLEFIAPRVKSTIDTHIYYLPIEYYFNPLAKLQFDLDVTQVDGEQESIEIVVLTRTV